MGLITCVQILGCTAPLRFGIAKNVQNSARFRTAFKFEREYLWNGWRYRQAVNGVINYLLSRVEKKFLVNFGPLTTTVSWLMSSYPSSTLRVLRILMRWSFGHVTLLREECEPSKLSSPIGLRAVGGLTLGFAPNF